MFIMAVYTHMVEFDKIVAAMMKKSGSLLSWLVIILLLLQNT